jgi:hypothetical protein
MSDPTLAENIGERAHQLRQLDGSLEGCADEYMRTARALVEEEFVASVAPHSLNALTSKPLRPEGDRLTVTATRL